MSDTTTHTPSANGILTRPAGAGATGMPGSAGAGEGMDRKVQGPRFKRNHILMAAGGGLVLLLLTYLIFFQDASRRLNVDLERLTVSTVQEGVFQEYIAVTGSVQPIRTIYLDAVVGGQVRERLVEEGAFVEAGQPILTLHNDNLTLQMMSSEAQLSEQINNIRNTRLSLDQHKLNLAQQMTELDFNLARLRREHDRTKTLFDRGVIGSQDYQQVREELEYTQRRRALTIEGQRQDSLSRAAQLSQMDASMGRLQRNLALIQSTMENLVVRAPVSGQLTSLSAEVGEQKMQGSRLGQIDVLDGFRVRVPIDEHYIARVAPGQRGAATIAGAEYELVITKVFPEVRDGRFEVDMAFAGQAPEDVRRGQTLRIRLALGDSENALLLPRGGFFQTTGGRWIYVLSADGSEAVRQPVQLGRQNPQFFEVTEGLRPGDRVVTSSYDTFGDADKLMLR
jgi:HlyD family secretion protein